MFGITYMALVRGLGVGQKEFEIVECERETRLPVV